MLVKSEGIVIRGTDYGESNKIITVFSREQGKIGMMARGAKKPRSRLAAISQLLTYGYYMYHHSGSQLVTLSQGEVIHSFYDIKQDLEKTAYAAYIVELLDKLSEPKEPNPYLFELLHLTLNYLQEGKDPEIITRIFEIKMLQAAGYRPRVDHCLACSNQLGPYLFSVKEGGFLCANCRHQDPYAIVLSEGAAKMLRFFQHFDLKRMGDINVKEETKEQLRQVLSQFIDEYTGVKLKSLQFLNQLRKLP